jgi:hypothetical protein
MRIDEELWRTHQYAVLVSFVHHLAYWRCSTKLYADLQQESEFWTYTIDAHLLRAVMDWCMVFGADSNRVHWKKVVLDESAQSDFRRHLLDRLSLSKDEWEAYWITMTTFRNDFAAHRVASSGYPTVPKMDKALGAAIAYDQWFRDVPRDSYILSFDEPPLSKRYDRLMRISAEPLREMISRGPTVNEEYEGKPPPRR